MGLGTAALGTLFWAGLCPSPAAVAVVQLVSLLLSLEVLSLPLLLLLLCQLLELLLQLLLQELLLLLSFWLLSWTCSSEALGGLGSRALVWAQRSGPKGPRPAAEGVWAQRPKTSRYSVLP